MILLLAAFAARGVVAADLSVAPAADGGAPATASTPTQPAPESDWPLFLGAQYTFVEQKQTALLSPYQGPLSLHPDGDRQGTHTMGLYTAWAPFRWGQLYFDTE